jgi:hypothetical protein
MTPSGAAERTSPDLRWLIDVVWGDLAGVSVDTDPDPGGAIERYLVVPSAARPRMLLPDDPAVASAALRSFNALRLPRVRWARAAASALVRAGAGKVAFRDRLTIRGSPQADTPARAFARALGLPEVMLSLNVRRPGPFRKPVAQLLSPGGRPVGFAKIGWNEVTRRGIEREAAALRAVAAGPRTRLTGPALRHLGPFGSHAVLITEPLPAGVRRFGSGLPPVDVTREVAELGSVVSCELGASHGWADVRARADAVAAAAATYGLGSVLPSFLDGVQRRHGATELRFGFWHGDWSPWNLGATRDSVVAWDWEYAADGVPFGMDLAHFHFQVAFIGERRPLAEAFDRARAGSSAPLARLGSTPAAVEAILAVHAAEITLRYLDAIALGASPNLRFLNDAPRVLSSLASGSG